MEDSVVLARMLFEKPELGGNAKRLKEATGWERRRFNPAFALVIPCVDPRRVRSVNQNEYPTLGVLLMDEDLPALRRHVERNAR